MLQVCFPYYFWCLLLGSQCGYVFPCHVLLVQWQRGSPLYTSQSCNCNAPSLHAAELLGMRAPAQTSSGIVVCRRVTSPPSRLLGGRRWTRPSGICSIWWHRSSMPSAWCSVCVEMMVFCSGECGDGIVQALSLDGRRAGRLLVTLCSWCRLWCCLVVPGHDRCKCMVELYVGRVRSHCRDRTRLAWLARDVIYSSPGRGQHDAAVEAHDVEGRVVACRRHRGHGQGYVVPQDD